VVGLLRPCALTKEALIITQHNTNSSVLVRADPNKFRQVCTCAAAYGCGSLGIIEACGCTGGT
jgi:hypothetical protein